MHPTVQIHILPNATNEIPPNTNAPSHYLQACALAALFLHFGLRLFSKTLTLLTAKLVQAIAKVVGLFVGVERTTRRLTPTYPPPPYTPPPRVSRPANDFEMDRFETRESEQIRLARILLQTERERVRVEQMKLEVEMKKLRVQNALAEREGLERVAGATRARATCEHLDRMAREEREHLDRIAQEELEHLDRLAHEEREQLG
ncbi:hypothetical protein BDK51DRAFT_32470 [Blyttiomyces helicus]|uniref:Uncharacterized protein n=1 Tax=Blyttiomyces helicus TaxID=388810 RepID=A0A4P9W1R1_9FUNG|nr:hypothetical protein BDK51DRAFT_32470 [Blyttiomyces helicus]|eukprot:RKO85295.1 hypothetical protein BDK51DRAFT_32470 [Blyttiomyces helicus]